MTKKITLSYTAINNFLISPHSWLNKQLGVQTITTPAMEAGKEAHKIIQDHCLGKKKDDRLKDFSWKFTSAERHVGKQYNDKYNLHGYIDLMGFNNKVICEIKTGNPWSQQRFYDSMQPLYYSYLTSFRKILFVTCRFDLSDFKTYYREVTEKDIEKIKAWIEKAVNGIEAGNFKEDLVDGLCTRFDCPYGEACYFKTKHEHSDST